MLSYPIEEAEELLSSKLAAAKQNLANCEEDHDFLREQITVRGPCTLAIRIQLIVANGEPDHGGRHRAGVQLGCHDEAERATGAGGAGGKGEEWQPQRLKSREQRPGV